MNYFELPDEAATAALGAALVKLVPRCRVVHLSGELGAGKTALVRGFLRAAGVEGSVRSPTFTLVETYETDIGPVYHFDLYRLEDPEELEFLGVRDFEAAVSAGGCMFFEWPERGDGVIPPADLEIAFAFRSEGRAVSVAASADGLVDALVGRPSDFPGKLPE